jgi:hypothetical protein
VTGDQIRSEPEASDWESDKERTRERIITGREVEQNRVILESEEIGPESDDRKSSEIKEVIVLAASLFRGSGDTALVS